MAQCHLESGESVDLNTRIGGGPVIRRGTLVDDEYMIEGTAGVLDRDEIKELAELAGFEVSDPEAGQ